MRMAEKKRNPLKLKKVFFFVGFNRNGTIESIFLPIQTEKWVISFEMFTYGRGEGEGRWADSFVELYKYFCDFQLRKVQTWMR